MERIYSIKVKERFEVMKLLVEGIMKEKEVAEKLIKWTPLSFFSRMIKMENLKIK